MAPSMTDSKPLLNVDTTDSAVSNTELLICSSCILLLSNVGTNDPNVSSTELITPPLSLLDHESVALIFLLGMSSALSIAPSSFSVTLSFL